MKLTKYNKRAPLFSNGQRCTKQEKEYKTASNVSVEMFMYHQISFHQI